VACFDYLALLTAELPVLPVETLPSSTPVV